MTAKRLLKLPCMAKGVRTGEPRLAGDSMANSNLIIRLHGPAAHVPEATRLVAQ